MNRTLTRLISSIMNKSFIAFVCSVAALGGLLFGYDTAVISGAIGYMSRHFGMTPALEGWTSSCVLLGCAVGAGSAGFVSDRIGRKRALRVVCQHSVPQSVRPVDLREIV